MVEGGGLESRFTGNRNQGSNPCLSAIQQRFYAPFASQGLLLVFLGCLCCVLMVIVFLSRSTRIPRSPHVTNGIAARLKSESRMTNIFRQITII